MISLTILRIFCLSLGLVFFWTVTEWLIYGVHMDSISKSMAKFRLIGRWALANKFTKRILT